METNASSSGTQRNPGIPLEFIVSEIASFPLVSVSAFENPVIFFDPEMKNNTARLWRDAERHILKAVPDLAIDMALAIRDQFWFDDKQDDPSSVFSMEKAPERELNTFLREMAKRLIDVRGDYAVPRTIGKDDPMASEVDNLEAIGKNKTLRWFSFAMPMDLLIGALENGGRLPTKIEYLAPQLFNCLREKGFSENHLHLGAGMEFPEFWVATLHRLACKLVHDDDFKSPGAEMDEGGQFARWLRRAAIARSLLACFLFQPRQGYSSFTCWLFKVAYRNIQEIRGSAEFEVVRHGLLELERGAFIPYGDFNMEPVLHRCYCDLISGNTLEKMDDRPEYIHLSDPIAFLTGFSPERSSSPEILFVSKALAYLDQGSKSGKPDRMFAALFWQVVRLRCIFYRHVTQRPMTPGLLWFIRAYGRISPGRRTMGAQLLVRTAARTCGLGKGLRALEVRRSPGDSVSELLKFTHDGLSALRGRDYCKKYKHLEFGWVFHFEKLRGDFNRKGLDKPDWSDTEADPYAVFSEACKTMRCFRNRYANYYVRKRACAMALGRLLFDFPNSLKTIRGVDVCTDELGVPAWVLVPCLRYVRDAGKEASRYLRQALGDAVYPLRISVHTGEDYVHLLGGIRRVEEAVRYFKLETGDRIGHGIALGTDPAAWAERTSRVAMRREDRLLDMIWEWSQCSRHVIPCSPGRRSYVEREIARLGEIIFGRQLEPYLLEQFVECLHDEECLRRVGYPYCNPDFIPFPEYGGLREPLSVQSLKEREINVEKLLRCYLTDPRIFKLGHKVEWVSVKPEIEAMIHLQNHVRKMMGTVGVVVEVNPTSNLLIANLADLKNHPFWRLNSPYGENDIPPVSICIGSDDPLTFATDLRREYALLYESLILGGLSASQAYEWIDKVRDIGLNSRFTIKLKPLEEDADKTSDWKDPELPRSIYALGLDDRVEKMP